MQQSMKTIYVIYTGGTIGMQKHANGYSPAPGLLEEKINKILSFNKSSNIPNYIINSYVPLIDSSDMNIEVINKIGCDIYDNYDKYDGFVILHGTDTMVYTATALSFMLTKLTKPIILTGAQEPITEVKSDSIDNFLNSLCFAANFPDIHEVCICFGGKLLRGNRAIKFSTKKYEAFLTPNCPVIYEATDKTKVGSKDGSILTKPNFCKLINKCKIDTLYLFPGFSRDLLKQRLLSLDALVIVGYGLGNAPTDSEFLKILSDAVQAGKILVCCSQCPHNLAQSSIYESGKKLEGAGVVNLYDITLAAAIFKIIYLSSCNLSTAKLKCKLQKNLCGEMGSVIGVCPKIPQS